PGSQRYSEERAISYRGATLRVNLDLPGRSQPAVINTAGSHGFELPLLDELTLLSPKIKLDEIAFTATGQRGGRGQLKGEIKLGPVTWARPPISERKVARIGAASL